MLWLRKMFGRPQDSRPAYRLTELEALEIARCALDAPRPLHVVSVTQTDQGAQWLIGTATVGSGTTVRIDDTTGEVLERKRWGVR